MIMTRYDILLAVWPVALRDRIALNLLFLD
jgi:hypothetical protein